MRGNRGSAGVQLRRTHQLQPDRLQGQTGTARRETAVGAHLVGGQATDELCEIGAAAVRWLDSLSARKLRRIKRFCVQSGRKMAEKADDLLG